MIHIADRIEKEREKKHSVLVVGLDPNIDFFPSFLSKTFSSDTSSLIFKVKAIEYFCLKILDWVSDLAVAIKPQMAYFERYGSLGLKVLEKVLEKAREKDVLIIMDAKRGDIGTTSSAYAEAFLGTGPLTGDFVTINPYLGSDSYIPFIKKANEMNKGVFLLLKTSNPSSKEIQDLKLQNGELLYEYLQKKINGMNLGIEGNNGYSNVGFVVGATHPKVGQAIRKQSPNNLLLVPGYGAQGGSEKDVAVFFQKGGGALVNSSRAILYPYRNKEGWEDISEKELKEAVISATIKAKEGLEIAAKESASDPL